MMARFSVLTRLVEPENSNLFAKMRVYDGENLKDVEPSAKSVQEYRDFAGIDEGMTGASTRFAYKVLSSVFNYDQTEVAANPVHLMYVLEQRILREQLPEDVQRRYLEFIKGYLAPRYAEFIGKEIQTAYLESYAEYGQNIFDRYVTYADYWIQDEDYRDPETGESFDRAQLNGELEKIEKPAGIAQPQGLQERDRQLRASRAGGERRDEPRVDRLREASRGHREEDVLEHRGAPAGHLVQREELERRSQQARELRRPHGREGLHREAGAAPLRVVPPGAEVAVGAPPCPSSSTGA